MKAAAIKLDDRNVSICKLSLVQVDISSNNVTFNTLKSMLDMLQHSSFSAAIC